MVRPKEHCRQKVSLEKVADKQLALLDYRRTPLEGINL